MTAGFNIALPAPIETLTDKWTVDEAGNWVRRLFVEWRDTAGNRIDRPLLTQADLETKEKGK